ncbi:EscU/YscU/HrcU family type III secretion system export apparatus switch protein [Siccirubricoccus sp. KC 17139]|uniref:EscU/YscU/HrcU family type III secretion system export apparatus switch protein n=1 Tax=Siccirubricoccus soli TaxID=2899147 RepID=A0ABT1DG52_9PROT|nr:EscU/YscU/HrcU family type III secretion system export apparatus switch protein [Siccirubricoccus soli]MCO6419910.1 EscU/YscU/HrcU family type III secretion system export apparatus switch protein [Siccirubricoccus soli]MCP2686045.1 EscU/YscU/HrcU family type III secretion system export apparatus switch protein [Siccirubricoccus soli]
MAEGEEKEAEDRTEAPSQRRLEKAREQGQVPLSREAVGFATLLAASIACLLALPPLGRDWLFAMRLILERAEPGLALPLVAALLQSSAFMLLPVLGLVGLAAILASLAQTGPGLHAEKLAPDLARLSPLAALRRLFGAEGLIELGRTLAKLILLGSALWQAVEPERLPSLLHQPIAALLAEAGRAVLRLLVAMLLAFGILAGLDLLLVRWRFLRQMRMSREDIREEQKESEGDPHIRARQRQIRETRARRRMLAQVPKATVVITNPTHYAVALLYAPGQAAAPRLVAKGADELAARIRAVAEEHGVPIVSNPPLARALFRLEPDTEVPAEHWQAVAEIIAYVWRLQGRQAGAAHG